ncbi:helix-turn-helix domain-containing protein [Ruminococcus sp.]|uniref:TetR/AcrR family transcriptional regulator n=1 Tax=Ruminococcus sp. TaxID=41978 RepID=UPI00257F3D1A|nr:helix-turn-helix domain-containing protein [Ruminococcus sp.]
MRTETAGVTETLIESAKKEFLEHGFQNANLRRISSESGVSTGSIYTRFGDKAGLFSAVVKPAADGLMELYLESITAARESGDPAEATSQGNEGTELVLNIFMKTLTFSSLSSAAQQERSMSIILTSLLR